YGGDRGPEGDHEQSSPRCAARVSDRWTKQRALRSPELRSPVAWGGAAEDCPGKLAQHSWDQGRAVHRDPGGAERRATNGRHYPDSAGFDLRLKSHIGLLSRPWGPHWIRCGDAGRPPHTT